MAWLGVCLVQVAGCRSKDRQEPVEPSVSGSATSADASVRREELSFSASLEASTAFELISTFDGAKLVWVEAKARGALKEQALTRMGELKGRPRELVGGNVDRGRMTDLAAAQLDRGVLIAWVEQMGEEARAQLAFSDEKTPPQLVDLGPAWTTNKTVRGNLAVAGARDFALAFLRGRQEPCAEGQSECFGFSLYRIDAGAAKSARGLPLSVPVPCSQHSTVLAVVNGRWHYGICTVQGDKPVTTVFSIQFDPEYAAAEQLLEGCRPLGFFEHEGQAWLSGDCEGERRATRVSGEKRVAQPLGGLAPRCVNGRVELGRAGFSHRLGKPEGGLEVLLGPPWVTESARAVWTGKSLLVATERGARVHLTRYVCR